MHVTFSIHAHVLHCTSDTVCDTLLGYVRPITSRYKFHAAQPADPRGQMISGATLHYFPELNGHYVRLRFPFLKEDVVKARTPSPYSGS